jgi:hypothetical protein
VAKRSAFVRQLREDSLEFDARLRPSTPQLREAEALALERDDLQWRTRVQMYHLLLRAFCERVGRLANAKCVVLPPLGLPAIRAETRQKWLVMMLKSTQNLSRERHPRRSACHLALDVGLPIDDLLGIDAAELDAKIDVRQTELYVDHVALLSGQNPDRIRAGANNRPIFVHLRELMKDAYVRWLAAFECDGERQVGEIVEMASQKHLQDPDVLFVPTVAVMPAETIGLDGEFEGFSVPIPGSHLTGLRKPAA